MIFSRLPSRFLSTSFALRTRKKAGRGRSPKKGERMNVSWNLETIRRFSTAVVTCAAIPAFVGLAYARWTKRTQKELPSWRNGVGLASMVIISALWLFQSIRWFLLSINRDVRFGTDSIWTEFDYVLPAYYFSAALPLAFALKRDPRLEMIAAWVLLGFYFGAFSYT
jgi:hypothetical protein